MARILAVDDMPLHLDYLQEELTHLGHEVVTAGDGQEALRAISEQEPDIVLLDLSMPGMDGLQVLQVLRKEEAYASLPVIMLTARKEYEDRIAGLDAGADDYITKPFHIGEVASRIKALLRIRDLQEGVLEREKTLAQLRGVGQTLVTLAHHLNNATQSISGTAQLAGEDPENVELSAQLRTVAIRQSEKISAVLQTLSRMVDSMEIHTSDYAGEPDRMLDIEAELKRRIDEIDFGS
jgi:CheY-like chemotaxis protein